MENTIEKRNLKEWEIRNFINRYHEILKVSEECNSMIEDLFGGLDLDSLSGDEPILSEIILLLETRSENIDNTIKQYLLLKEMIKKVEGMNNK